MVMLFSISSGGSFHEFVYAHEETVMGGASDFSSFVSGGDDRGDFLSFYGGDGGGDGDGAAGKGGGFVGEGDEAAYGGFIFFEVWGKGFAGSLFHEGRKDRCGKDGKAPALYYLCCFIFHDCMLKGCRYSFFNHFYFLLVFFLL